jgi:hypothetical protein
MNIINKQRPKWITDAATSCSMVNPIINKQAWIDAIAKIIEKLAPDQTQRGPTDYKPSVWVSVENPNHPNGIESSWVYSKGNYYTANTLDLLELAPLPKERTQREKDMDFAASFLEDGLTMAEIEKAINYGRYGK